jgi:hypothetical protein
MRPAKAEGKARSRKISEITDLASTGPGPGEVDSSFLSSEPGFQQTTVSCVPRSSVTCSFLTSNLRAATPPLWIGTASHSLLTHSRSWRLDQP